MHNRVVAPSPRIAGYFHRCGTGTVGCMPRNRTVSHAALHGAPAERVSTLLRDQLTEQGLTVTEL